MTFYATGTTGALIAATVDTLRSHGHTILGEPMGPFANVSLLKTDPNIGPQFAADVGTVGGPWYVIASQA